MQLSYYNYTTEFKNRVMGHMFEFVLESYLDFYSNYFRGKYFRNVGTTQEV